MTNKLLQMRKRRLKRFNALPPVTARRQALNINRDFLNRTATLIYTNILTLGIIPNKEYIFIFVFQNLL